MKSKLKLMMVAAAAVIGSSGAFAAIPCTGVQTSLDKLVNECAPEVTFYVSGASAQKAALETVLKTSNIFDLTKVKGKITSANTSVSGKNTLAYIGYGHADLGIAGAGKRVIVIYNSGNGSGAGVKLLLSNKGTGAGEEIQMATATVKDLLKNITPLCSVIEPTSVTATDKFGTAVCSNELKVGAGWAVDAQKKIHMAISDVRPNELAPGVVASWKPATFPATATAVQGFGVAVSPMLYKAMQAKDVAAGRIASSCNAETVGVNGTTDTTNGLCQPSISRAEYASIITGKMGVHELTSNGATTATLILARRVNFSGSQAASNIAFANQAGYNVKPTLNTMAEIKAAGSFTVPGTSSTLVVTEGAGTGDVISWVRNTETFAIGVISLENVYKVIPDTNSTTGKGSLQGALYVKVEGMSPNYSCSSVDSVPTCALNSLQRVSLQNGYPLAYEAVTLVSSTIAEPYKKIAETITAGLKDASLGDLAGMAYTFDSTGTNPAAKMTSFKRGASNYLPLVKN